MKRIFFPLLICLLLGAVSASAKKNKTETHLVVGIVVDQMRYDYLYRFSAHYGANGFNRLLKKGFSFDNCHYNYVPTYTGPGHSSIFTGTTPSVHGIVSNDWLDQKSGRVMYCTRDDAQAGVGSTGEEGKMSPANMLTGTVGDMLRLSNNRQSRVYGISLKDRSAILPAGHMANAAYWFDGKTGNFISSTYYLKELPEWVKKFNALRYPEMFLSQPWKPLLPSEKYRECLPDSNAFEKSFTKRAAVFPHNIPAAFEEKKNFNLLREIPYGNTLLKDFAISLFRNEKPGLGEQYDFVSISFSSTDYVGHRFGVSSMETEDTYIRLDRDLSELFAFLDSTYGKENYTLFLTADHGACEVPAYLQSVGMPSGYFSSDSLLDSLKKYALKTFGKQYIQGIDNNMVYLVKDIPAAESEFVAKKIADDLLLFPGIAAALTASELRSVQYADVPRSLMQKGYFRNRGGEVFFCLSPGWMEYSRTGSTHGSSFSYDTRVPLLFYGKGICHGNSSKRVEITDIAPSICRMLNIAFPDGCTGNPLNEYFIKSAP